MYGNGGDGGPSPYAMLGPDGDNGSPLMQMLLCSAIVPGTQPSYQLCKTIYSYHPLGAVLTDAPISRAQAQRREIKVPGLAEGRLIERFWRVWDDLGKDGATVIIHDLMSTSRTYGIASLAVGVRGEPTDTEIDFKNIGSEKVELFFNVLDPLNTAGSLVLDQDPNSPDFLKPIGDVRVAGVAWHPSRLFSKLNGRPIYIEYTSAAFGFVGRSVYQRALFPMKSFVQSMITDDMVTKKAGLLVAKMKAPGSVIDNLMQAMFAWKRGELKSGSTGMVLSIGVDESIETLNMMNLDKAAGFARTNILKNIASAADMPASIVNNETLTEGFGEGSEDFKKEVQYLNYIRTDMGPLYNFIDQIVMRKAWSIEYFESLKSEYPELRAIEYTTWLFGRMHAFTAAWPNLMEEPDSEKSKMEDVQMKSAVALAEIMMPELDPVNKAKMLMWISENANEREALFASKLSLDEDALEEHLMANADAMNEMREAQAVGVGEEPRAPRPFAAAS